MYCHQNLDFPTQYSDSRVSTVTHVLTQMCYRDSPRGGTWHLSPPHTHVQYFHNTHALFVYSTCGSHWLSFSNCRCWWCCSCSPSKLEVFEEGCCVAHERCDSVANCWLVWEVAGGVSWVPQTLWGRYEMCIQMNVDVCSHSVPVWYWKMVLRSFLQ